MPTPPVDSPYCVHCGYERAGLEPDATHCPECGHSLSDTRILSMTIPPRWWRLHRAGWEFFRFTGIILIGSGALFGLATGVVVVERLIGDGSATWPASLLGNFSRVLIGVLMLCILLNAIGGVCCFAGVPTESPKDRRHARLFSLFSLAIPLLALPAAYAVGFKLAVPREIIIACAILSIVLISIDARLLPGRVHAFLRFTTNEFEKSFMDEGNKFIDSYGFFALLFVAHAMVTGSNMNLITFLYLFATVAWISRRAQAARAVRKEITQSQHQPRRSRPPDPPTPRIRTQNTA